MEVREVQRFVRNQRNTNTLFHSTARCQTIYWTTGTSEGSRSRLYLILKQHTPKTMLQLYKMKIVISAIVLNHLVMRSNLTRNRCDNFDTGI